MATRKRPSSRSRLNQAVSAGRSALRRAERRLPPDLRQQIERSVKDGQKTFEGALKEIRSRVNQAALQADLDKALKRLDGLGKQVERLARSAASGAGVGAARKPAARKPAARKPAARKPAARKPAARKPAAPKRATPKAAAARRSTPRRAVAKPPPGPTIRYIPPPPPAEPGPVPERVDPTG